MIIAPFKIDFKLIDIVDIYIVQFKFGSYSIDIIIILYIYMRCGSVQLSSHLSDKWDRVRSSVPLPSTSTQLCELFTYTVAA